MHCSFALVVLALAVVTPGAATLAAESALDAHGGPVKGVALSADGTRALSAGFDYSIIHWDLERQVLLQRLIGHEAAVNAVAFLPGERALSASDDGTLGLWDLDTGARIARLEAHRGRVTALAVAGDGGLAASAGWDRTLRLWDLEQGREIRRMEADGDLNAVAFSGDGAHVLAGASDGAVLVHRVADGTRLATLKAHDFAVTSLDVGENGVGVTASVDETVQLWDLAAGEPTRTLFGHEGPVLDVALSADETLVASGGMDGTVRVWRRGDGDRLRVYARHQGPVWSVAFAPGGEVLVSGGADGLVLTYDLDQPADGGAEVETARAAAPDRLMNPPGFVDDGSRGARLFRKCAACHTLVADGGNRAGPTLHGLFGREAGALPDYPYSEALEESDLVWTAETVSRLFEVGPETLVPGSKMPLQRMPDPADRAALVDYLERVGGEQ